jgi:hypothetical protein
MKTELFIPHHLVTLCGENADQELVSSAIVSQISGPAFTLMTDKNEILGCGGLRIQGVAQAWGYFSKDGLRDMKKTILRKSQAAMNKMIAENRIYKTYADPEAPDSWFRHMGFVKQENVFVR